MIIHQVEIAEQLAVSHDLMSLTLKKMVADGQIEIAKVLIHNVKRYRITPPENAGPKINQKKAIAWG